MFTVSLIFFCHFCLLFWDFANTIIICGCFRLYSSSCSWTFSSSSSSSSQGVSDNIFEAHAASVTLTYIYIWINKPYIYMHGMRLFNYIYAPATFFFFFRYNAPATFGLYCFSSVTESIYLLNKVAGLYIFGAHTNFFSLFSFSWYYLLVGFKKRLKHLPTMPKIKPIYFGLFNYWIKIHTHLENKLQGNRKYVGKPIN